MSATFNLQKKVTWLSLVARNPSGDPDVAEAAVYKDQPNDISGLSFSTDPLGKLRIQKIHTKAVLGDQSVLKVR
jgi:hypothetical protein